MNAAPPAVFEARLGGIVRGITWIGGLALVALLLAGVLHARDPLRLWAMVVVPAGVLGFCWALRPLGYAIEPGGIYVLRPIGRKRIGARHDVATADDEALRGAWRLCGNGGLFGATGWYRTRKYGTFRAWVTDPACLVVLQGEGRTAVISPRERARFLDAVGRPRA